MMKIGNNGGDENFINRVFLIGANTYFNSKLFGVKVV